MHITINADDVGILRQAAKTMRKNATSETPTMPDKRQAQMFEGVETGTGVAALEIKAFIERIERLEEEKAGVAEDIKDVFAELKGRGFDAKAIRQILKIRKQDHSERQEQEAILELYMQALGMV